MDIKTAIERLSSFTDEGSHKSNFQQVCEIAITALKKQIPRKCKEFKDVCDCGYGIYPHMNYCSRCGRALDWSND